MTVTSAPPAATQFAYGHAPKTELGIGIVCALFAAGCALVATQNSVGLQFGPLVFGPGGATMVWWTAALALVGGAIWFIMPALAKTLPSGALILAEDSMTTPGQGSETTIRYDDIDSIDEIKDSGRPMIKVEHLDGELVLDSIAFEGPAAFQRVLKELRYRARFSAAP